jgi:hypothetical protein
MEQMRGFHLWVPGEREMGLVICSSPFLGLNSELNSKKSKGALMYFGAD